MMGCVPYQREAGNNYLLLSDRLKFGFNPLTLAPLGRTKVYVSGFECTINLSRIPSRDE